MSAILAPENGYAGTNSILTLRPKARAALPKVARVTEVFVASSSRSNAARLVRIRLAIAALVNDFWSRSFSRASTSKTLVNGSPK